MWRNVTFLPTGSSGRATDPSAAPPAPVLWPPANTPGPGGGGGRTRKTRSAACTGAESAKAVSDILHRFSRTELLVGAEGLNRLRNSSAIFGLGGIGSFAAEAVCRAGVGRFTIVDFDDICLTNVNRQLHALDGTVGKAKIRVMAERLRIINPSAEITAFREFYAQESSDLMLARLSQFSW
jgi:hypothetical protein